jgi:hypothetical protein
MEVRKTTERSKIQDGRKEAEVGKENEGRKEGR